MATQVPIPKLGQSEETVSIVKWHKSEGDTVTKGDVLFEVETDKAVLEVESQFEGTLLKVVIAEGVEVPVMSIACVLGEPGEAIPEIKQPTAAQPEAETTSKPAPSPPSPEPAPSPAPTRPEPPAASTEASHTAPQPKPAQQIAPPAQPASAPKRAVSPRAKTYAKDFLINLDDIEGTGPGGRVVERDVRGYLESSGYLDLKPTPAALNLANNLDLELLRVTPTGATGRITVADVRRTDAERPKAMTKVRQIIARRLQQSKQQIPHFYVTVSVDMTDLIAFRKEAKKSGFALSFNDFVLKACALSLREFPAVNSVTDDGLTTSWRSRVNVGMAVSIENGLVVPVLSDTDRMSMDEVHDVARDLADRAREGKLLPEEMKDGTFTVSNMGMLNVEQFSAIINPGESAILAVSSIVPSAFVDAAREIVVRDMMKVTLSADHRVVDGALAAMFVNSVKRRLEDIDGWREMIGV